jgi:hypothetical protein
MIFTPYELPRYLNKDYMDGYQEGYEACKVDMLRVIKSMTPFITETSTTEVSDD